MKLERAKAGRIKPPPDSSGWSQTSSTVTLKMKEGFLSKHPLFARNLARNVHLTVPHNNHTARFLMLLFQLLQMKLGTREN